MNIKRSETEIKIKKLALRRESLRALSTTDLSQVVGGSHQPGGPAYSGA